MKKIYILSFFLLVFSSLFSLFTKKEASRLTLEIKKISKDLSKNKEKINTLRTELDYITQPKRIGRLSQSYLKKNRPLKRSDILSNNKKNKDR